MSKLFPSMNSKPETIKIFLLAGGYVWIFVLVPLFMPFLGLGLWEDWENSAWLEIGYHVLNGLVMLFLIGDYLKDEWFMVTMDFRFYLKHMALTVGLMVGTTLLILGEWYVCGLNPEYLANGMPVVEMFVSHTPGFLVSLKPLFGTLALSLFSPFCICALFYCCVFAPVCCRKPWLAYVCVALVTLIPPIVNIIWRGDALYVLCAYAFNLPVHLLACWSYQKTDNVWTPLVSLMVSNLLMSVVPMLMFG